MDTPRCSLAARMRLVIVLIVLLSFIIPIPAGAEALPPDYGDLLGKAASQASVRLIVGLDLPTTFRTEGELSSPAGVSSQRSAIETTQAALVDELTAYQAEVHRRYETIPFLAMTVDEAALQVLINSPTVASLSEDVPVPPTLLSSTDVINAPEVWTAGYSGSGQAVVILDTGIDLDHPFFGDPTGRIVAEACFSDAYGTQVSLCPAGGSTQMGPGAADAETSACYDGTWNICTHGSHVAGIAAGRDYTGGPGYSGVAPDADIIAIQVFTRYDDAADCSPFSAPCVMSYVSDQIAALEYVYTTLSGTYDIAAVNMSLGGDSYNDQVTCDLANSGRKTAIDNLRSAGIATVIASGNNGYTDALGTPACISSAVAVGSTTDANEISSFSNIHEMVDLLAPGSGINSAIPDNTYGSKSGTSMATPHVAGAWAVLRSANPTATVDEILAALQDTGVQVTDMRSGGIYTKPRIRLDTALIAARPFIWEGSVSEDWGTAGNWSTGALPDAWTDVRIPAAPSGGRFPTSGGAAVVGDLTLEAGASLTMSGGSLEVHRNWENLGTFAATGSEVTLAGYLDGLVFSGGDTFSDLTVGDGVNAKSVTLNDDLDVDGDLMIAAGATLDGGRRTIHVAGDWTDAGTGFAPGSGTVVLDGAVQALSGLNTVSTALTEDFSDYDAFPDPGFTYGAPDGWSTEDAGDGTPTYNTWWFGRDSSVNPDDGGFAVRWRDGTADYIDAWLFSPAVDLDSGAVYTISYKYRVLASGDDQDFSVWLGDAANSGSMSRSVWSVADATNTSWTVVDQRFSVDADGTYHLGFRNEDNPWGGSYGILLDNIALTEDTGLVFYDLVVASSEAATVDRDLTVKHNLTVNSDGKFDLGGRGLVVNGTLANNGTISQTLDVPGGSTTNFLHVQNGTGTSDKYWGMALTPSGDMGSTTVAIRGNQACTSQGTNDTVNRCFDVVPGTSQAATVRFYYLDAELTDQVAGDMLVWHWNGGVPWEQAGTVAARGTASPGYNWVEVDGVSSYSPFVLDDDVGGPSVVAVRRIGTRGTPSLAVLPVALLALAVMLARRRR